MGRGDVHTEFWYGKLGERDLLEDPDVDGKIILKRTLRKWDGVEWTGLVWLRMRTCGGLQ